MAFTPDEQAAIDRMADYNGGRYDATTNSHGFAGVGYKTQFPAACNDTGTVAQAVSRIADGASQLTAAQSTLAMSWDTGTTDANPGAGNVRASTATLTSGSYTLYISTTDAAGGDATNTLAGYGSSTSAIKGRLRLVKIGTPSAYVDVDVTGVTTATGYRKVAVNYVAGPGGFVVADAMALGYVRNGDAGPIGNTGAAGAGPVWYGTSAGTANAQTLSGPLAALTGHPSVEWISGSGLTNTGALTLAVGSTAATAVRTADGVALSGGEVVAGTKYVVTYDGTYWRLGGGGLPGATGAEAAAGTSTSKAVTPAALAGWLPNLSLLASANINKDTDRIPVLSTTAGGMRWIKPAFLGGMSLATKTASYTAIVSDNTAGIKFTAAATLTLPSASTLPADWAVTVLARSTGTVLIAAAGSDTVAGSAAFTLRSGQDCRITRESSSSFEVTAVGQSVYDSLAAWNPAAKGAGVVLSNNNLTATCPGSNSVRATIGASAGKRYFEGVFTGSNFAALGVATSAATLAGAPGSDASGWSYLSDGRKYTGGTATAYGSSVSNGGIVRVAHDPATGNLWFGVGAVWQGSGDPATGANPTFTGVLGTLFPATGSYGGSPDAVVTGVFAASSFAYSPPSGFTPYI